MSEHDVTSQDESSNHGPCSLCGSSDVEVRMMIEEDGEVENRALCDLHAAKLERWWKRNHQQYKPEGKDAT